MSKNAYILDNDTSERFLFSHILIQKVLKGKTYISLVVPPNVKGKARLTPTLPPPTVRQIPPTKNESLKEFVRVSGNHWKRMLAISAESSSGAFPHQILSTDSRISQIGGLIVLIFGPVKKFCTMV